MGAEGGVHLRLNGVVIGVQHELEEAEALVGRVDLLEKAVHLAVGNLHNVEHADSHILAVTVEEKAHTDGGHTVAGIRDRDGLLAGFGGFNVGVLDVLGVHGLDELAGRIEHGENLPVFLYTTIYPLFPVLSTGGIVDAAGKKISPPEENRAILREKSGR